MLRQTIQSIAIIFTITLCLAACTQPADNAANPSLENVGPVVIIPGPTEAELGNTLGAGPDVDVVESAAVAADEEEETGDDAEQEDDQEEEEVAEQDDTIIDPLTVIRTTPEDGDLWEATRSRVAIYFSDAVTPSELTSQIKVSSPNCATNHGIKDLERFLGLGQAVWFNVMMRIRDCDYEIRVLAGTKNHDGSKELREDYVFTLKAPEDKEEPRNVFYIPNGNFLAELGLGVTQERVVTDARRAGLNQRDIYEHKCMADEAIVGLGIKIDEGRLTAIEEVICRNVKYLNVALKSAGRASDFIITDPATQVRWTRLTPARLSRRGESKAIIASTGYAFTGLSSQTARPHKSFKHLGVLTKKVDTNQGQFVPATEWHQILLGNQAIQPYRSYCPANSVITGIKVAYKKTNAFFAPNEMSVAGFKAHCAPLELKPVR